MARAFKTHVIAVASAVDVSAHYPEMLGAERRIDATTADGRTNMLVCVPGHSLVRGCAPVAGRSSVLKINRGD